MPQSNPQPHGSSVVEDVDPEAFEPEHIYELIDPIRKILERVFESSARKQVRLTKARQVRRYQMKAVGEKRNQIAEHVTGARKPVQQQQGWSVSPASFAIRNLEAANIRDAIINLLHRNLPLDNFCPTVCVGGPSQLHPCS